MRKSHLIKTKPLKKKKANQRNLLKSLAKLEQVKTQIELSKKKLSPKKLYYKSKLRAKQKKQSDKLQK